MRLLMICIGSTGDVRPYILLGRELKKRGHKICICAFKSFKESVESEGFEFASIDWDSVEFMKEIMQSNKGGIDYLKNVNNQLRNLAEPMVYAIDKAAKNAEAIISVFFGSLSQRIAEKHGLKYVQTHYYPMDINDVAPISTVKGYKAGKLWFRTSYKLGYIVINSLESIYIKKYSKVYKLKQKKISTKPVYQISGKSFPVIYAMSKCILPHQEYWDDNMHVVGYFVDKSQVIFTPSNELAEFLSNGSKPIYIGFGSMVAEKLEKYINISLKALEITGQRAIIVKGWGDINISSDNKNVLICNAMPHDYIFEKVSVVVHHGGAGTFAAGLSHAKPTLILPFGGDQSFSARRAYDLGIGPRPINPDWLTAEKFAKRLLALENNPQYRMKAQALSKIVNSENGVQTAANIIEEYLNK